jgi:hypothetical protein
MPSEGSDRSHRRADDALGASGRSLSAWVASLVADDAARSRARTAWLARQAAEEGTFAGVLVDLAERGAAVVVHLHNGRRHRGVLTVVGRDFCGLRTGGGSDVLVADRGVASVRTLPGDAVTVGDRPVRTDLGFAETVAALADHRVRVLVVGHDADDAVAGELRSVGADVVTVRLDGAGGTAYVSSSSVLELSLTVSG